MEKVPRQKWIGVVDMQDIGMDCDRRYGGITPNLIDQTEPFQWQAIMMGILVLPNEMTNRELLLPNA